MEAALISEYRLHAGFPSCVIVERGKVVARASWEWGPAPDHKGLCQYGRDLWVAPGRRREGLGYLVAYERQLWGAQLGAVAFIGATRAANRSMIRLFKRLGYDYLTTIPDHYTDPPADAVVYIHPLR